MRSAFDRRVVASAVLGFVARCQERTSCHLGGGVALAAAYLGHRTTGDVDLFCHREGELRELARILPQVARESGGAVEILRDAGHLVRARLVTADASVALAWSQLTPVSSSISSTSLSRTSSHRRRRSRESSSSRSPTCAPPS